MSDESFKQSHRTAVCVSNPIEHLIPKDCSQAILEAIKQESIAEYGYDVLGECSKRKVCFSKKCLGRELPWKSKSAFPYLEVLTKTNKIENDLLFIETDCANCKIFDSCKKPCNQVTDYLNRDRNVAIKTSANEPFDSVYTITDNGNTTTFTANIPWDALSDRRRAVIKLHLYDRRDFKYIAKELDINNQSRAKYEYYAALTTVSEYAIVREFLSKSLSKLTEKQQVIMKRVYYDNVTLVDVAKESGVSKQAIQQMVTRVVTKHNIKWTKFVWKKGTKIIYNVPKVLK